MKLFESYEFYELNVIFKVTLPLKLIHIAPVLPATRKTPCQTLQRN